MKIPTAAHPLVLASLPPAGKYLLPIVVVAALSACSKPVEKTEDIRPVRVMKIAADNAEVLAEFAGEIKPRIESRLGFRVGGKIVARKVDIGTAVKRGQILMQLDPQDLQLAQAASNAGLKAAESNHALAKAELARYKELRDKNFVSQAVLDAKETAYKAASASYEQALAAYKNQSNQTGYSTLVADGDGVVTGIDAEIGQVVAAGTPVVRIAQLGEKEVAIGIPEDKVDSLRRIPDVQVRLWARPNEAIAGKIREISPIADPVTRTYAARVAIPAAPADIKLGMTAYVSFTAKTVQPVVKLPLSALFRDQAGSAVWVVENGTVRLAPIQISAPSGNELLVSHGVSQGQTVVTAGVHLLKQGQKVKILGDEAVAKTADLSHEGALTAATAPGAAK